MSPIRLVIMFAMLCAFFAPLSPARADCTLTSSGETRPEGTMIYNKDWDLVQACQADGSWRSLHPYDTSGTCLLDGKRLPDGGSHTFFIAAGHPNCAANSQLRNCAAGVLDGDPQYAFANCSLVAQDNTPDAFAFTNLTEQTLNVRVESDVVTINGIGPLPVNVTRNGDGWPEFRIDGGTWGSTGTILNGQTLQMRLTSSVNDNTTQTATITVGTVTVTWTVRTGGQTPDVFTFTDVTTPDLNTVKTSNIVTMSGLGTNPVPVTLSGTGGWPQFSINGGDWGTTGTIVNGQTLQLRKTSATTTGVTYTTTVKVGTVSVPWSVVTEEPDPCTVGALGTPCIDNAVYIGNNPVNNQRIYAAPSNETATAWNNGTNSFVATMTSCSSATGAEDTCYNGYANTTILFNLGTSPSPAPYQAARLCRNKGEDWYLPSIRELKVISDNRDYLSGVESGYYWSSSEASNITARTMRLSNGGAFVSDKDNQEKIRCVRR